MIELSEWNKNKVMLAERLLHYLSSEKNDTSELEKSLRYFALQQQKWGQTRVSFDSEDLYWDYYDKQSPHSCFEEEGGYSLLPYTYQEAIDILKKTPIALPLRVRKYTIMEYEYRDHRTIYGEDFADLSFRLVYFSNRLLCLIPRTYLRWCNSLIHVYWLAYIKYPTKNITNRIAWHFYKIFFNKDIGRRTHIHVWRAIKDMAEENPKS